MKSEVRKRYINWIGWRKSPSMSLRNLRPSKIHHWAPPTTLRLFSTFSFFIHHYFRYLQNSLDMYDKFLIGKWKAKKKKEREKCVRCPLCCDDLWCHFISFVFNQFLCAPFLAIVVCVCARACWVCACDEMLHLSALFFFMWPQGCHCASWIKIFSLSFTRPTKKWSLKLEEKTMKINVKHPYCCTCRQAATAGSGRHWTNRSMPLWRRFEERKCWIH